MVKKQKQNTYKFAFSPNDLHTLISFIWMGFLYIGKKKKKCIADKFSNKIIHDRHHNFPEKQIKNPASGRYIAVQVVHRRMSHLSHSRLPGLYFYSWGTWGNTQPTARLPEVAL